MFVAPWRDREDWKREVADDSEMGGRSVPVVGSGLALRMVMFAGLESAAGAGEKGEGPRMEMKSVVMSTDVERLRLEMGVGVGQVMEP